MSTEPEKFVLRTTLTSPFGRKARMAADVLGLRDRVTVVHADVADENDTLRQQNPLGKIPCLVRADGTTVYDSGVILECLQEVAGTDRLMPARGPDRIRKFTMARLADGIIDAGALIIYEGRYHEPGAQSERWMALSARQDRPRARCFRTRSARCRARAMPSRSALPARSSSSTGARRSSGGRHTRVSWPFSTRSRRTSRRTSAPIRRLETSLLHNQPGHGCIDASPARTEESNHECPYLVVRCITPVVRWLPVIAFAVSGLAHAQAWPSKPVRIIVPISVGGATDLLGRTLAQALQQSTGQPFVVENKTGAAGAIGSAEVARAAPDGYTLLIATTSTHSIAPHVSSKLPYNVVDDFTPIALLAEANNVLLMSPTLECQESGRAAGGWRKRSPVPSITRAAASVRGAT